MRRWVTVAVAVMLVGGSVPVMGTAFDDPPDPVDTGEAQTTEAGDPLETATIVRDEFGVPHIYADSEEALWYASGYAQAQDRLWGMDVLRHLGHGELTQLLGAGFLGEDTGNERALYSEERMREMLAESPGWYREALRAFADGVNRAAAEMHASGDMPAEYPALQRTFDPWEPIDTVAIGVYILGRFGAFGGEELTNARLLDTLEEDLDDPQAWSAFEDFVWARHDDTYTTNHGPGDFVQPQPDAFASRDLVPEAQLEATRAAADSVGFDGVKGSLLEPGSPSQSSAGTSAVPGQNGDDNRILAGADLNLYKGSNALVVGPQHSAVDGGKAMLAGGPQLGYFTPPILYELGLHGPGLSAEGSNIMGTPGVSSAGHNGDIAWTTTSGNTDQIDSVALEAEGNRSYVWPGENGGEEVRDLDCRTEEHVISTPPALHSGDPDEPVVDVVEQEVCRADLSPIGEEPERLHPLLRITDDEQGDPAWFFVKRDPTRGLEVADGVARMEAVRADSTDAFREALDDHASNFFQLVAGLDASGEQAICSFHVGHVPVRDSSLDPRLPRPAGDAWLPEATLTGDEIPDECNPEEGYLVNWNNAPADGWGSGDQREKWGEVHRVERLDRSFQDVLEANGGSLDVADVKAFVEQATTRHSLAFDVVPALLAHDPGTAPGVTEALQEWKAADYTWAATDGEYDHEGMTVFEQLTPELLDLLFNEALDGHGYSLHWDPGERHAADHGKGTNSFSVLVEAFDGTTNVGWCASVEGAQTCEDVLEIALANTGLDQHQTAEEIPATQLHHSSSMSLGLGPSYEIPMMNRATYDQIHVGSEGEGFASLPPGASGHVNPVDAALLLGLGEDPEHMGDQVEPYAEFDYKHVPIAEIDHWEQRGNATTIVAP